MALPLPLLSFFATTTPTSGRRGPTRAKEKSRALPFSLLSLPQLQPRQEEGQQQHEQRKKLRALALPCPIVVVATLASAP